MGIVTWNLVRFSFSSTYIIYNTNFYSSNKLVTYIQFIIASYEIWYKFKFIPIFVSFLSFSFWNYSFFFLVCVCLIIQNIVYVTMSVIQYRIIIEQFNIFLSGFLCKIIKNNNNNNLLTIQKYFVKFTLHFYIIFIYLLL